jgi:dihydroxy-acid dehydratase
VGGPIAWVQDGDPIVIDAEAKRIDWLVDDETKKKRQAEWEKRVPPLKERRGVLFRYARDVAVSLSPQGSRQQYIHSFYEQPASEGAYCD